MYDNFRCALFLVQSVLVDDKFYCLLQVFFWKCPKNTVDGSSSTEKQECRRPHHAIFAGKLLIIGAVHNIQFSELQLIAILSSQFVVNWLDCLTMGTLWMPELHNNQLFCPKICSSQSPAFTSSVCSSMMCPLLSCVLSVNTIFSLRGCFFFIVY
jgi:hypothetical protein